MDSLAITYSQVRRTFLRGDQSTVVLDGVDFSVNPAEFVALMGPSGSGKSTLLNLTAGIDTPTSGRVLVGEVDPATLSESARADWRSRTIGLVFQRYHLLDVLTAAENVEVPLLLFGLSKSERRRRVATALELVGLADRAAHYPRQLSGGQEQRVAIARALVTDPAIILADEPTGDLDGTAAEGVLGLLELLNRERRKTVVMVTHDPAAARRASRVMQLAKGVFSEARGFAHAS